MHELTIAAVAVEAVTGPAGRFPYPELWQVVPLDVYLSPGEPAAAPPEPDPDQIVEALYLRIRPGKARTACTARWIRWRPGR